MNAHVDIKHGTKHVMNIMDRTGHTTLEWDEDDGASVKAAEAKFKDYLKRGYQAFAIKIEQVDGGVTVEERGRRIETFDPTIAKIMLIPQMQGG